MLRFRQLIILEAILVVAAILVIVFTLPQPKVSELNPADVNDVVKQSEKNWGSLDAGDYSTSAPAFAVVDMQGTVLYSNSDATRYDFSESIKNRDTLQPLMVNGVQVGTAIFFNNELASLSSYRDNVRLVSLGMIALLVLINAIYLVYLQRNVIKPFSELKDVASHIARGDLNHPLTMDKHNLFGAFTESFDIMREELLASQEREAQALQSKQELVASLSHDIKTPVSSIKAVVELMQARETDDGKKDQLAVVDVKATQIDRLISDLFHATLEQLDQLQVTVAECESTLLIQAIRDADYLHKVEPLHIPDSLVECDILRFGQVVDNVIANSYKYANTRIEVMSAFTVDGYLSIKIRDFGSGADLENISILTEKFVRGENAQGVSGSGLGLYISNYLMTAMGGSLEIESHEGFVVTLKLRLAGS